jgi:Rrf2 family protein
MGALTMKISTKGRYGTRAMLYLALNYKKGMVMLKNISLNEGISIRYLENIMRNLVVSGLVISAKGKNGGFALARNPGNIKLKEILEVLEGSLAPIDCIDNAEICKRSINCTARNIWCDLKDVISNYLDSISLEDMVNQHQKYPE